MNRRLAWAVLGAAVVLALAALAVAVRRDRAPAATGAASTGDAAGASTADLTEPLEIELFFPGAGGRLVGEIRQVAPAADSAALVARVVEGLLEGPRAELSEASFPPFPSGVTLGRVHVDADGTAYVDLRSEAHPNPPVTGSTAEMLNLYSLVNSVVRNVEEVRAVAVLWNGRQPRTFGGHIDTTHPLLPARFLEAS